MSLALASPTRHSRASASDLGRGRASLYLHPGQLAVSRAPAIVTTILGSCVSVCLWDAGARIGGLNHFLLPLGSGERAVALRFGDSAIDALIAALTRLGVRRAALRAKVFGGACVGADGEPLALGGRNVEQALATLGRHSIPIEARDTGGSRGRKVRFQTDDGSAWVKEL